MTEICLCRIDHEMGKRKTTFQSRGHLPTEIIQTKPRPAREIQNDSKSKQKSMENETNSLLWCWDFHERLESMAWLLAANANMPRANIQSHWTSPNFHLWTNWSTTCRILSSRWSCPWKQQTRATIMSYAFGTMQSLTTRIEVVTRWPSTTLTSRVGQCHLSLLWTGVTVFFSRRDEACV